MYIIGAFLAFLSFLTRALRVKEKQVTHTNTRQEQHHKRNLPLNDRAKHGRKVVLLPPVLCNMCKKRKENSYRLTLFRKPSL